MLQSTGILTDYDRPIEITKGVFWVGFTDSEGRLQCNPYLIVDDDEAVLIRGGRGNSDSALSGFPA